MSRRTGSQLLARLREGASCAERLPIQAAGTGHARSASSTIAPKRDVRNPRTKPLYMSNPAPRSSHLRFSKRSAAAGLLLMVRRPHVAQSTVSPVPLRPCHRAVSRLAPTQRLHELSRRNQESTWHLLLMRRRRNPNGTSPANSAALLLIGSRTSLPWSHPPFGTATHGPLLRQPIHHVPRNSLKGLRHTLGVQSGVSW